MREDYFGTPASEKNTSTRHIESDDPKATAHDFYDRIAYGGVEEPLPNYRNEGKGVRMELSDDTKIVFRDQSNSSEKSLALRFDVTRNVESGDIKTQQATCAFVEGLLHAKCRCRTVSHVGYCVWLLAQDAGAS